MQHNLSDMHLIRTLQPWQMADVRSHFLHLGAEDRKLRFGSAISDEAINDYVDGFNPMTDRFLGYSNADGHIVGVVHMCYGANQTVEFAFSVDRSYRTRGIGTALFEQAILWARNRHMRHAFVFCLAENVAMRRLAVRAGMDVRVESGECDCMLPLAPPTPLTMLAELAAEQRAFFVGSLDTNRRFIDGVYGVLAA